MNALTSIACFLKKICLITIVGLMIFSGACKQGVKDDHPEYFGAFFSRHDKSEADSSRVPIIDSLERAMLRFPVGDGDNVRFYRLKADHYRILKDYQKAFLYLDSIDGIANQRSKNKRFADVYVENLLFRSNCYLHMKNYDAALDYLLLARNGADLSDPCNMALYNERMAELYYQLRRYEVAAGYYQQVIMHSERCEKNSYDKFVVKQGNLDNIALCFIGAEMYDSAGYYCQYALDYISRNEPQHPQNAAFIQLSKAVVKGNYARVKRKQKRYAEAEQMNIGSIAVTAHVYNDFARSSRFELVQLYLDWYKLDKAALELKTLDSLYRFQQRGKMEEERMEWNLAMKKLAEKKGNITQAFDYNKKYLFLRDSLDLLAKNNVNRDLGEELENKEQGVLNMSLEKKNETRSFQLIIVLLLSAMAIGTIVFIWHNLRRKAEHLKLLEHLNKEILTKNDELNKAFVSLEESQADNTKITRMVAHDLKNPIGGIRNLVYSMLQKEQPEDFGEMLELIKTSCNNSIVLINDLVKEKSTPGQNRKELVDIHRVLQYCVNILQLKAEEKNQCLYLEGDRVMVFANREKMWRVISNLLSNAIKFSPENAVINVKLQRKGERLLLSVQDRGIGIPEELKDKIFTLQPEASRMGTAGEESHGLGLSISLKIVEEHEGRIWFESNEGQGSTFYVELPGVN